MYFVIYVMGMDSCGRERMVVGSTTTYANSDYHH